MTILKVSRLEGLSDGIFAIAMTILALDLRLPPHIDSTHLVSVMENVVFFKLFIYIGSFIILGTLWIAMTFQIGLLQRLNRPYLWTHVLYLMVICVVPFSASLVAAYPTNPASIIFFAINLLCASVAQFIIAQCAYYFQLNNELYTPAIRHAIVKRIYVAPLFYFLSIALAYWHPHLAFLALIAPILIYILPGAVDRFDQPPA
ncbi:MAG: DUF1211 domain-containing protein [Gammaproteobacteria bacterium]|nr:DUF1211 domain-containing protein [Gammaproteobacteria bacterium]